LRLIAFISLFLFSCGASVIPPVKPVAKDTIYVPQQYVMVRTCTTGTIYAYDTSQVYSNYANSELYYLVDSFLGFEKTEVRDTIVFKDGKWFFPTPLCDCWGCLDSLRIEKIK
jgi:hypothetical protein